MWCSAVCWAFSVSLVVQPGRGMLVSQHDGTSPTSYRPIHRVRQGTSPFRPHRPLARLWGRARRRFSQGLGARTFLPGHRAKWKLEQRVGRIVPAPHQSRNEDSRSSRRASTVLFPLSLKGLDRDHYHGGILVTSLAFSIQDIGTRQYETFLFSFGDLN